MKEKKLTTAMTNPLKSSPGSDSSISPDWPAPKHVGALFTTRPGAIGGKPFDSFNLTASAGACEHPVPGPETRFIQGHKPESIYWLHQVHEVTVVEASQSRLNKIPKADASYTKTPGIACAVLVADCLPVLVTDRAGNCVGAAHAGWRGLCSGIIPGLIAKMRTDPDQTLVWLGPCIGPNSFEVGPEVLESFKTSGSFASVDVSAAFKKARGNRYMGDLRELAGMQLASMGIRDVFHTGDCTYENAERYFSYRRDGATGRMAALIWIK